MANPTLHRPRLRSTPGNTYMDIRGAQSVKRAGNIDTQADGSLTEKVAAQSKRVTAGGQQIMGLAMHLAARALTRFH